MSSFNRIDPPQNPSPTRGKRAVAPQTAFRGGLCAPPIFGESPDSPGGLEKCWRRRWPEAPSLSLVEAVGCVLERGQEGRGLPDETAPGQLPQTLCDAHMQPSSVALGGCPMTSMLIGLAGLT